MSSSNLRPLPITLSPDEIDELIYDARSNDLDALKTEIEILSKKYNCSASSIIFSAVDLEDESEGGTGGCLLHWPAANGYLDILTFLLQAISPPSSSPLPPGTQEKESINHRTEFLNHRNHAGNTPLHWATLNTQLECVQALVKAGADMTVKNDSGFDAIFLAEQQVNWSTDTETDNVEAQAEAEAVAEDRNGPAPTLYEVYGARVESRARHVIDWLLASGDADRLERPVVGNSRPEYDEQGENSRGAGRRRSDGGYGVDSFKLI